VRERGCYEGKEIGKEGGKTTYLLERQDLVLGVDESPGEAGATQQDRGHHTREPAVTWRRKRGGGKGRQRKSECALGRKVEAFLSRARALQNKDKGRKGRGERDQETELAQSQPAPLTAPLLP